jgi:flavin reductase (DIM6/NTAB) family NADH-FMN oxidoreductase RutF
LERSQPMNIDLANAEKRQIYSLLCGLIAPRPVAWITSMNAAGHLDAAPFSAFNYVGMDPPIVAVGIANEPGPGAIAKQTAQNIRNTGEFVVNVVNEAVAETMNFTAIDFPPEIKHLEIGALKTEPSLIVKVPRIAASPASLECRELMTMEIGRNRIILGQVVAVHVKDEFIDQTGHYIRAEELHAIGRMNGLGAYVKTRDAFFSIPRVTYAECQKKNGKQSQ